VCINKLQRAEFHHQQADALKINLALVNIHALSFVCCSSLMIIIRTLSPRLLPHSTQRVK